MARFLAHPLNAPARRPAPRWIATLGLGLGLGIWAQAWAAPVTYLIDPEHTYPSFEADHMGLSTWRGKFNKSSGKVILDKAAGQGTLEVTIDTASIDFGHELMNKAPAAPRCSMWKYPQAVYVGRLEAFAGGVPTQASGELTLHGVTRPMTLQLIRFRCVPHFIHRKREVCGADALASFRRDDYGIDVGRLFGFSMDVTLRIQVEALEAAE